VSQSSQPQPARQQLCYLDVGGTFTDAFVVDEAGDFVIGKALTTPGDISRGLFAAIENAYVAACAVTPRKAG